MNYKTDKIEKGRISRLTDGIKEYFGPLPFFSGLLVAGAAQVIAFSIGATYRGGNDFLNFLDNGNGDIISALYNIPSNASELYSYAKDLAGDFGIPGFAVGQFLGYRFKKTVSSLFKKARKDRR